MRHEHPFRCLVAASVVLALAGGGCRRRIFAPAQPEISMHVPSGPSGRASVDVRGLTADELSILRDTPLSVDRWREFLKITVARNGPPESLPPVEGAYAVTDSAVVFTPLFPFDPGRAYHVRLNPGRFPRGVEAPPVEAVVSLPATATEPSTVVLAVYPGAAVVPENLLRMYVEFSAPMGNGAARDFVRIFEKQGEHAWREVAMPFLPLEAPLWNPDHTRCTVFFDPGRVKQGIRPNEDLGRPLRAGRQYVLEVSTAWPDANGQPLKAAFRHEFRTRAADAQAILPSSWRIEAPAPGTRNPLMVTFARPLDHGLLSRALGVETRDGRPFEGDVTLDAHDTRWLYTPNAPWAAGTYDLVALSILEDPSGNRIGRPFEADLRGPVVEHSPDEYRVPFIVGGEPARTVR